MSELLLVNPRRKRRVKSRRRSARRMTARQRQFSGKRRRHRTRRRHVEVMEANPRRRRSGRRVSRRRHRMVKRARARVARLRGFNVNSFMRNTLIPSAIGAGGALAVDVALGYLNPNLPAFMTTGIGQPLTKIAAAVALGMAAGMATNRQIGEQVMAGAVTVVAYNYIRQQVQAAMPSVPLAGYHMGYAGPALAYPDRMGMYVGNGGAPALPPQVVAAIAANAAAKGTVAAPSAPAAQTVGEYVSSYERGYNY